MRGSNPWPGAVTGTARGPSRSGGREPSPMPRAEPARRGWWSRTMTRSPSRPARGSCCRPRSSPKVGAWCRGATGSGARAFRTGPASPRRERALTGARAGGPRPRASHRGRGVRRSRARCRARTAPARPRATAALATELVYGTLRWQRYLDWILAPHSKRRLDTLDPRPLVALRLDRLSDRLPRPGAGLRRRERRRQPRRPGAAGRRGLRECRAPLVRAARSARTRAPTARRSDRGPGHALVVSHMAGRPLGGALRRVGCGESHAGDERAPSPHAPDQYAAVHA